MVWSKCPKLVQCSRSNRIIIFSPSFCRWPKVIVRSQKEENLDLVSIKDANELRRRDWLISRIKLRGTAIQIPWLPIHFSHRPFPPRNILNFWAQSIHPASEHNSYKLLNILLAIVAFRDHRIDFLTLKHKICHELDYHVDSKKNNLDSENWPININGDDNVKVSRWDCNLFFTIESF